MSDICDTILCQENFVKIIAIEEHYWTEELRSYLRSRTDYPMIKVFEDDNHTKVERLLYSPHHISNIGSGMGEKLIDIGDTRLKDMDENGIDMQVLSFQTKLDTFGSEAPIIAKQTNSILAKAINQFPKRFAGFACLSLSYPESAALELERSVKELGFKGAMIFSSIDAGKYLDDEKCWAVFEKAEQLSVPIYIHPAAPSTDMLKGYNGYPMLMGSMWGYAMDAGLAAMRLICSGIFDKYPDLTIILGHLGEGLPHWLWRIDNRWEKEKISLSPAGKKLKKKPGQYFKENFYVTTSGMLSFPALLSTSLVTGTDRILFAADYPWEKNSEAVEFMDSVSLSDFDKEKILHINAEKLLGV